MCNLYPAINADYAIDFTPQDIPNLVSYWDFASGGTHFVAQQGEAYTLTSATGELAAVHDGERTGIQIKEGDYLTIPRKNCPRLDIHGPAGHLTVMAWIKRERTLHGGCEFIAGQWNETAGGRQYGLFINIGVWQTSHAVCAHVSNTGRATPGFRYCMDGAFSKAEVPCDAWSAVGMSYDGCSAFAWLNGKLDYQPVLNPYALAGGLNDGGPKGSDFTVGGVHRSGEFGNFFTGCLSALAVYDRALTPAEMSALGRGCASTSLPPAMNR